MLKKSLILSLTASLSFVACSYLSWNPNAVFTPNLYDSEDYYYYQHNDRIIIAPEIKSGAIHIEYTLDDKYKHTLSEMPFVLELSADTLSVGMHTIKITQQLLNYAGGTQSSPSPDVTFFIL